MFWTEFWENLTLSDVLLLLSIPAALGMFVLYTVFTIRKVVKDPLAAVIAFSSLATVLLLFLIVWAILFGQKVDEGYRVFIGMVVLIAVWGKFTVWVALRFQGARARRDAEEAHEADLRKKRAALAAEHLHPTSTHTSAGEPGDD